MTKYDINGKMEDNTAVEMTAWQHECQHECGKTEVRNG